MSGITPANVMSPRSLTLKEGTEQDTTHPVRKCVTGLKVYSSASAFWFDTRPVYTIGFPDSIKDECKLFHHQTLLCCWVAGHSTLLRNFSF